jgi:hypothetical protein
MRKYEQRRIQVRLPLLEDQGKEVLPWRLFLSLGAAETRQLIE